MLNKEQQQAVMSDSKRILVLAGAGSGKTRTMISRVSRLVNDGVSVANVLVLTFTNAAAFEMEERYRKDHKGRISPNFSTFHAFCYSLISTDKNVRSALGYTEIPNLPDEAVIKMIETQTKQQCGTKLSKEKLSGKSVLTQKEQFEYDIYWKRFKQLLKLSGHITFDIMCYDVCQLFKDDSDIIQKYKEQYKYIFVDEFQDTDPKQWDFIKSFSDSNLFVVGDVFQAIYAFRGADSSIIKSLSTDPEWETIKLNYNYRSTKQICEFANNINKNSDNQYKVELVSDVEGNAVDVQPIFNTQYVNPVMEKILAEISISNQNQFKSVAILCRTNSEVSNVKQIFDSLSVKYISNDIHSDLANIAKSILDSEYLVRWLSTKLSAAQYAEYAKLCIVDETYNSEEKFMELYYTQYQVGPLYDSIQRIRHTLHSNKLQYQKCIDVFKELGISNRLVDITSDTSNEDLLNYIINITEDSKTSNIYVGTIHSVKGLEYDSVYVLGVDGPSFRLTSEELRNLYYVACTRAKSLLYVYI